MATPTAKSMDCCLGPIPLRKTSNTWPENSAYRSSSITSIDRKPGARAVSTNLYWRRRLSVLVSTWAWSTGEHRPRPCGPRPWRERRHSTSSRSTAVAPAACARRYASNAMDRDRSVVGKPDSGRGPNVRFSGWVGLAVDRSWGEPRIWVLLDGASPEFTSDE